MHQLDKLVLFMEQMMKTLEELKIEYKNQTKILEEIKELIGGSNGSNRLD